jgi:FMN reductase
MPLATGGTTAHVLALDYGLRPVLQLLGARHIVQSFFVLQSEIDADAGR